MLQPIVRTQTFALRWEVLSRVMESQLKLEGSATGDKWETRETVECVRPGVVLTCSSSSLWRVWRTQFAPGLEGRSADRRGCQIDRCLNKGIKTPRRAVNGFETKWEAVAGVEWTREAEKNLLELVGLVLRELTGKVQSRARTAWQPMLLCVCVERHRRAAGVSGGSRV